MLCKRVVTEVLQIWGSPQVNIFSTQLNNQLPVFVSPVPNPLVLEYDALSMDWSGQDILRLPSSSPSQQGIDQNGSSSMQSDFDCSGLGSATLVFTTSVTPIGGISSLTVVA